MATIIERKGPMHNPPHPGELLASILDELKVSITAAAEAFGVSRKHVSSIVNGSASITPDMAARLGGALRMDAGMWLSMQASYDSWILSQATPPKVKRLRAA